MEMQLLVFTVVTNKVNRKIYIFFSGKCGRYLAKETVTEVFFLVFQSCEYFYHLANDVILD